MRFSLALPVGRQDLDEEFTSPEAIAEMARAVEQAGFDACHVTWAAFHLPAPSRAIWLDNVARFGEEAIAKLRDRE